MGGSTTCYLSIYSLMDVGATIVGNAAVHMGAQILVQVFVFTPFGFLPKTQNGWVMR